MDDTFCFGLIWLSSNDLCEILSQLPVNESETCFSCYSKQTFKIRAATTKIHRNIDCYESSKWFNNLPVCTFYYWNLKRWQKGMVLYYMIIYLCFKIPPVLTIPVLSSYFFPLSFIALNGQSIVFCVLLY